MTWPIPAKPTYYVKITVPPDVLKAHAKLARRLLRCQMRTAN
jgi:hypothetical protein